MKRIILTLLAITLLLSLLSCGNKSYTDDVKTSSLGELAVTAIGNKDDYSVAESGYLDDYFVLPDYVTESEIRFATEGKNLDEIGVFHVTNGKVKDMETLLKGYLSKSYENNRDWYDSYIPEETPKLRDAEVKVFGNYAVYAICSDADRDKVFDSIEQALLK